jgi:HTH-type transcriptional regulator, competence development regulator
MLRSSKQDDPMTFGTRIRDLRQTRNLTLRDVAKKVQVTFTYLSKIENQKLSFGEFPSNDLIIKLASALDSDPDELLLLAEKIPDAIRKRVLQRPDVFRKIADLDDRRLDEVLEYLNSTGK